VIFVTVGTQLPFPRLMQYVVNIAANTPRTIIAQTGDPAFASTVFEHHVAIPPARFDSIFAAADIVVGHAGIGTILSARRLGKPLIIVPRRGALNEHRNDHQSATAQAMRDVAGVYVAENEAELAKLLEAGDLTSPQDHTSAMRRQLIANVQAFIAV